MVTRDRRLTDLQSLLSPQDSRKPALERADSTFDQRHRFVFSGVYQSGTVIGAQGVVTLDISDWTVAPIIELASGTAVQHSYRNGPELRY